MGYYFFFSCKIFSDLIPAVVILFCTKFTDFSDNIDRYKNFFGPLGYSASAYVMVGPERYSLQTADAFPVVCCSQATNGINPLDLGPGFFSEVRTPALNDYASRRPSCLLESIERLYQSSFIFYTGPQTHYTQTKLGPKAPEWLRKSPGKSKP